MECAIEIFTFEHSSLRSTPARKWYEENLGSINRYDIPWTVKTRIS
jgi:hypothetical protein